MHKRARGWHDDPLSAASAGLLALRVSRARRTSTLDLLGAMIDLADAEGHVEVDRPLYEVEQLVGMNDALESYTWLEHLGVVARTPSGWQIQAFAQHRGPVGATAASMEVLRRHLDSIGADAAGGAERADAEIVAMPVPASRPPKAGSSEVLVPIKRWRRAVPLAAAGIAASVAVVAGVSQFVPQAAVSGRNAALHADAPTSVVKKATSATEAAVKAANGAAAPGSSVVTPSTSAGAVTPTTASGGAAVTCIGPRVVAAVTSVDIVALPLAGDHGQTIWAAVVNGTATLTDSTASLLLPGLSVVGHVVGGDTDAVLATLGAPLLVPNIATPFTAVVALGDAKPATAVTATATPTGLKTCP